MVTCSGLPKNNNLLRINKDEVKKNLTQLPNSCIKSTVKTKYVFVLRPSLFHPRGSRTRTLTSKCKIGLAEFTEWMSFLLSNLMGETSPNPEALTGNT